ncbi:MAG: amidase family protein, partial [Gemmatimonas sp.]
MSILDRDTYNAFCRHTHVSLDGAPSGPLAGLTFGLKDLFDVEGHRTGFGSPDWLRTHEPALEHAAVLPPLLAAGASMVGKTHTEEMAFSLTGENAHYGTPRNPAAPGRVPGGSSSGSAVAVAAGLVD